MSSYLWITRLQGPREDGSVGSRPGQRVVVPAADRFALRKCLHMQRDTGGCSLTVRSVETWPMALDFAIRRKALGAVPHSGGVS